MEEITQHESLKQKKNLDQRRIKKKENAWK